MVYGRVLELVEEEEEEMEKEVVVVVVVVDPRERLKERRR